MSTKEERLITGVDEEGSSNKLLLAFRGGNALWGREGAVFKERKMKWRNAIFEKHERGIGGLGSPLFVSGKGTPGREPIRDHSMEMLVFTWKSGNHKRDAF